MNLKEFLKEKAISASEFAMMVGYSYPAIMMHLKGKTPVTDKFAKAAEIISKGSITKQDLTEYVEHMKKIKQQQKNALIQAADLAVKVSECVCVKCKKKLIEIGLLVTNDGD